MDVVALFLASFAFSFYFIRIHLPTVPTGGEDLPVETFWMLLLALLDRCMHYLRALLPRAFYTPFTATCVAHSATYTLLFTFTHATHTTYRAYLRRHTVTFALPTVGPLCGSFAGALRLFTLDCAVRRGRGRSSLRCRVAHTRHVRVVRLPFCLFFACRIHAAAPRLRSSHGMFCTRRIPAALPVAFTALPLHLLPHALGSKQREIIGIPPYPPPPPPSSLPPISPSSSSSDINQ